MGKQIGSGAFATVAQGRLNENEVAIKTITVDEKATEDKVLKIFENFQREVSYMRFALPHLNNLQLTLTLSLPLTFTLIPPPLSHSHSHPRPSLSH